MVLTNHTLNTETTITTRDMVLKQPSLLMLRCLKTHHAIYIMVLNNHLTYEIVLKTKNGRSLYYAFVNHCKTCHVVLMNKQCNMHYGAQMLHMYSAWTNTVGMFGLTIISVHGYGAVEQI